LQRLHNLKQLGFTDKVYPDAVHARFNHILGATEVVERIATRLKSWLRSHPSAEFEYAVPQPAEPKRKSALVKAPVLADQLQCSTRALRLMALLHDVTHAAFGHTLEDEVNLFNEKHDDPARQIRVLQCSSRTTPVYLVH
jgi:HD superfamily phosphohydrolase